MLEHLRWNSQIEGRGVMTRRLFLCVAALVWTQSSPAQEPRCRLYKVQSNSINISKEPRGDGRGRANGIKRGRERKDIEAADEDRVAQKPE